MVALLHCLQKVNLHNYFSSATFLSIKLHQSLRKNIFNSNPNSISTSNYLISLANNTRICSRRTFIEKDNDEEEDEENGSCCRRFQEAVELFNGGDYYRCHDVLEALWNKSNEPSRTLMHGILQCSVGFHHLFNQNHRGAMMELGEGLCKLRKLNLENGSPFHLFETEIDAVLDFIYKTQLEYAACSDDICLTMDQSERSYQLLGGFGAGQLLYHLKHDQEDDCNFIVFSSEKFINGGSQSQSQRIKLPLLQASEEHLNTLINSSL